MKRRRFLQNLAGASAITAMDWLGFFRRFGIPGSKKELGLMQAAAQSASQQPRFLIYWFLEGGWDGYSMFNPLESDRNDARLSIPANTLRPTPGWSEQLYRPVGYPDAPFLPPREHLGIRYGFLAEDGKELFADGVVLSSHYGKTFHSGSRLDYHYGTYASPPKLSAQREDGERTVLQAFCEARGGAYLLPSVSWHRFLADGELPEFGYGPKTGFRDDLGPSHAHTFYGGTPGNLRKYLASIYDRSPSARSKRIREFTDDLHRSFLDDAGGAGPSAAAFRSALETYRAQVDRAPDSVDPSKLFNDPALKADFGVTAEDEVTRAYPTPNQPALPRSKNSPNVNVQAMMAYELMAHGLSCSFFIENREVRAFDTHRTRKEVLDAQGLVNQREKMRTELWNPLKTLVQKLKATEYRGTGTSLWNYTTVVVASEMGRVLGGNVDGILARSDSDAAKYQRIMDQDVNQHWPVSSAFILGGTVRGGRQLGKVGRVTRDAIPLMPDGALDPAYDADTGHLVAGRTKSPKSFVTNAGHLYATALALSGVDPAGVGKNISPALSFVGK